MARPASAPQLASIAHDQQGVFEGHLRINPLGVWRWAERFGDAIVEIYPRGALDGVPVHQGYIAREAEWPVELSPAELSSRASAQVPSAVAREILSEMGIHVPRKIGNGDIDPLLEYDVPKLTPEQIAHFVEEAHRRVG